MPDPTAELGSAVLAALEPLVGGLSGERAARGRKYPRISLGRTTVHDWSSGAATGEQLLTVHVLTREEDEAARLKESVRTRLGEGLDLGGGRIARLRLEFDETRTDEEFSLHRGLLRFRVSIVESPG
jgi:hypothetical protein